MPRNYRAAFAGLILVFSAAAPLAAQDLTGISFGMPTARISALGGPHAALTDDINTLFDNPAGFNTAKPELSVSALSTNLRGPIFDIAGVALGASSGDIAGVLSSPNVQNLLASIYTGMNLLGPIFFGYVGNGLGFGIFNGSSVTLENTAPLSLALGISEQLILSGGYAFRIPLPQATNSTLDMGLLLKGSLKGTSLLSVSFFQLPGLLQSPSATTLTGAPFDFTSAIGLDVGLKYSFRNLISVGIVGKDLFSPSMTNSYPSLDSFFQNTATPTVSSGLLPINLCAGILFTPSLGWLEGYVSDFKLMVDYNDILAVVTHPATADNPLLEIGIGTEVTLFRALALRAGFYQGLFSAGLGLNLGIFRFDASMFGAEISTEPGLRPIYNLMLDLSFRI